MQLGAFVGNRSISDFPILWDNGERVVRRAQTQNARGEQDSVLVVQTSSEYPSNLGAHRFANEYKLKDQLDSRWAVRPIDLIDGTGRTTLVLEDVNGKPLDALVGAPLKIERFLELAIATTGAVSEFHQRGLVHKDIKPANVIIDNATGEAKLTGFGMASRLISERTSPRPPEMIAGTLAYMAPEQTGRMNRSVDSRSDLYALGVTFYQMLTGSLPFDAVDPIDWVHCHLARLPVAPAERRREIPEIISAVVMKQLSKLAEDRYQTAAGLEIDLRRCRDEWISHFCIAPFPLGAQDTPHRLVLPEKLYGRQREVDALSAAFDRIAQGGASELFLVKGYSGIGKSSLVNELQPALVSRRGQFAGGKFDQYKRDIPYATLAQAFQSLVHPLMAKPAVELNVWRKSLQDALGSNAQLMVDLVPELNLIIGAQSPVAELPAHEAQQRFQLIFRKFLAVFATPEHPLALFLDDLQWLDGATLDLLEALLTHSEVRNVLLIGAYRDNEVTAAHPLARKLDALRNSGRVHDLTLGPLAKDDLSALLSDSLHIGSDEAAGLADLLHLKTAGNPFFSIQFIKTLADEGLIFFDNKKTRWTFDGNGIFAKQYTDNVIDLLIGKMTKLPEISRNYLKLFACFGSAADIATLSIIFDSPEDEVHTFLWDAIQQQFVERSDSSYKFVHDRVQEAAYQTLSTESQTEIHLMIGRLLAAHTVIDKRENKLFEIANQLNRGAPLITTRSEREDLAQLNLAAGKRARSAAAYAAARHYFQAGIGLLSDASWASLRDVHFELELYLSECEMLTGHFDTADQRLSQLHQRTVSITEQSSVARLRNTLCLTTGRNEQAVTTCLDYLKAQGIDWSQHPTDEEAEEEYQKVWAAARDREVEELVALPLMSDPEALATLEILATVLISSLSRDQNLFCMFASRAANLSLQYGNSDASCVAYAWFGTIARAHKHPDAAKFGRLARELVDQRGLIRFQTGTFLVLTAYFAFWTEHVRVSWDLCRRGFKSANESGELVRAVACLDFLSSLLLLGGQPLGEVEAEVEFGLAYAKSIQFEQEIGIHTARLAAVRALRGITPTLFLPGIEASDHLLDNESPEVYVECIYWAAKLQYCAIMNDYQTGLVASGKLGRILASLPLPYLSTAEYQFYSAICHAALAEPAKPNVSQAHYEELTNFHRLVQACAVDCPANFLDRASLLGAEVARIEGRELDAMRLYEQAIQAARLHGNLSTEALSNEVAARFYSTNTFQIIADAHLQQALNCYRRWGASAKVGALEKALSGIAPPEPPRSAGVITAPVEQLDFATVVKVSQIVSSEVVLDKLIDALLRLAIESAGAERGLLLLSRGHDLWPEAEAVTGREGITVRKGDLSAAYPRSIAQYVQDNRDAVVLDDASVHQNYSLDPYVQDHKVRSLLCLPLVNESRLKGMLLLENNLTSHAFTPDRVTVLKVLVSQAAISLENSRLYHDLQDREERFRDYAETASDWFWEMGPDFRFTHLTENAFKFDSANRIGTASWDYALDLEAEPLKWKLVRETLDSRVAFRDFVYCAASGGGTPMYVKASGKPVFDADGEFLGYRGTGSDVTAIVQAQEALRESEQRMRSAIDGIPGLVAILAPNGDVEAINRQIVDYCGKPLNELKNWAINGIIHSDDLQHLADVFAKSIASGIPYDFEARLRRFDGEYRWFEIRGIPVHGPSNSILRWYVLLTDIEERTRALGRLQQLQSDFARMNRVSIMGELAASLSHEITQPIASARNNARAALNFLNKQTIDLGEVMEALSCVVGDTDRAGSIISRVRDQVRKMPPRKDDFDLNEAINEMIGLARNAIVKSGVAVQLDLAAGMPAINGDRVQLQQVILNLVLNAVEAMTPIETRARELIVKTARDDENVIVAVSDSGPGIDPAFIDRIFEAFYTSKSGGTGMGLPICRSIVQAHGGRLWVEPNNPQGAVFRFKIPFVEAVS